MGEQYYCLSPPTMAKVSFTGSGHESNLDDGADKCKLFELSGLSVEFGNVIYFVDAQSYCTKIFSTLHKTAKFIGTSKNLSKTFSVYEKREIMSCGSYIKHVAY